MDIPTEKPITDQWYLYTQMLRCRIFEEAVRHLWLDGSISGEMHLSMGEEAIAVGVVSQLVDGDALALDHRGTAPLMVRGIDPTLLLREFLGRPDGLGGGMGGHMHLFSAEHLAASSGIVGASGPAAVGFALANQHLRPGKISVAFFGEGAVNEGMLLESFNLAATWKLPVMFICKNNDMAVVTRSADVTGGDLIERAKGFGLRGVDVDGRDAEKVWIVANEEIRRLRQGDGPVFVNAYCEHLEGHFLGDQLLRYEHRSISETIKMAVPLVKAHTQSKGAPIRERTAALREMLAIIRETVGKHRSNEGDPIALLRNKLATQDLEKLQAIETQVHEEIGKVLERATQPLGQTGGQEA